MTTLLLVLAAYAVFVGFVLAILTAAKHADELAERWHGELPAAVEALPAHGALGRLVADVRSALDVDRVTVVVSDPAEPASGLVGACIGARGLVGSRVHVEAEPVTGTLSAAQAAVLGLAAETDDDGPWTYAYVPIAGGDEVLGAVTVASRRARAFTQRELTSIECLARRGAGQFDRRSVVRG
jgi:signal transduction protein with GAF and PtsI domain